MMNQQSPSQYVNSMQYTNNCSNNNNNNIRIPYSSINDIDSRIKNDNNYNINNINHLMDEYNKTYSVSGGSNSYAVNPPPIINTHTYTHTHAHPLINKINNAFSDNFDDNQHLTTNPSTHVNCCKYNNVKTFANNNNCTYNTIHPFFTKHINITHAHPLFNNNNANHKHRICTNHKNDSITTHVLNSQQMYAHSNIGDDNINILPSNSYNTYNSYHNFSESSASNSPDSSEHRSQENIKIKNDSNNGVKLVNTKSNRGRKKIDRSEFMNAEGRYQCKLCAKSYKRYNDLKGHYAIHGENTKCCPHCQKKFSRPIYLRDHIRTHTGEKPFNCDICHKRFAATRNLVQHRKRHFRENSRLIVIKPDAVNYQMTSPKKNELDYN